MAKKKYLAIIIITFLFHNKSLSTPYIPPKGHYKITFNSQISDAYTKDFISRKEKRCIEIRKSISNLETEKYELIQSMMGYENPNEFLDTGFKTAAIDKKIAALQDEIELLHQYTDRYYFKNIVEYGLNDASSIGIMVERKKLSFYKENKIFQNAAFFYKKQLYNKKKFIMSSHIQAKFDEYHDTSKIFGEIGIEMAFIKRLQKYYFDDEKKLRRKNIGQFIAEYHIHYGFPVCKSKTQKDRSYLSIARSMTIKSLSGWYVSRYFMLTLKNTSKLAYARTFFTKHAIGREFTFSNNARASFEIGHFKNQSEYFERLRISGLTISLNIEF